GALQAHELLLGPDAESGTRGVEEEVLDALAVGVVHGGGDDEEVRDGTVPDADLLAVDHVGGAVCGKGRGRAPEVVRRTTRIGVRVAEDGSSRSPPSDQVTQRTGGEQGQVGARPQAVLDGQAPTDRHRPAHGDLYDAEGV